MQGSQIAREILEDEKYEKKMKLKYSRGKYRINAEKCMKKECRHCKYEKYCFRGEIYDQR